MHDYTKDISLRFHYNLMRNVDRSCTDKRLKLKSKMSCNSCKKISVKQKIMIICTTTLGIENFYKVTTNFMHIGRVVQTKDENLDP